MLSPRRAPKILVADDDPVIRNNLRTLLESEHYQTVEAADGRQASTAFEDDNIALALLDLRMPECSGLDLLRQYQDLFMDINGAIGTVKKSIKLRS